MVQDPGLAEPPIFFVQYCPQIVCHFIVATMGSYALRILKLHENSKKGGVLVLGENVSNFGEYVSDVYQVVEGDGVHHPEAKSGDAVLKVDLRLQVHRGSPRSLSM